MVQDVELTRDPGDRRLYVLEGIGTLRLHGLASRNATAEARGRTLEISRQGFWRPKILATNADGTTVGEFAGAGLKRGGALRWGERGLALRPASAWRDRYALADGDDELAIFDAKGWGKRPVKVTFDTGKPVEPMLVLFAAFVANRLAEDTGAAAAATTTAVSPPAS